MESATIIMPLAPVSAVFCFPSEANIPERPEYKKNINTISMYVEKLLLEHPLSAIHRRL